MRSAASLCLAFLSLAVSPSSAGSERIAALWSTYLGHCPQIVADAQGYFAKIDEMTEGRPYLINSHAEHDFLALQIDYGDYKLRYDAGFAGGKTFMSCGVESSDTGSDLEGFAAMLTDHARSLSEDVVVSGGLIPMKDLWGGGVHTTDGNYFYYITGASGDVDSVTFIQLLQNFLSLYFHHVFEGRVGLPDPLPEYKERLK